MKRQISFAEAESHGKKRVTRRQCFLTEMESVVPWQRLITAVEPYYPKGKRGRPPIGLERMLRVYFLQQWYGLSDEALEDALYDSMAMRAFAGIDLAVEAVPDATTLLKFRRLLVAHELTRKRAKAQIRARVEHPFHVIKNLFGHRKVRYKGLVKNTAQLFSLFGLANLALARKLLLASQGSNPS